MNIAEAAADLLFALKRYPRPRSGKAPRVIAHRGAWDRVGNPENTLAAFECARLLGAHGIEFDVHFTADGVPVVHHDRTLARMFKHPGVLENMTLKDIRSVTPEVPTLKEVLALTELHFMIEIKVQMSPAQLKTLNECLEGLKPLTDYHLLTIEPSIVRESAKTPREAWILVGQLNLRPLVNLSIERGYGGVAGHYLGLTQEDIKRLHAKKQIAGAGFVSSKNIFNREWSRKIDYAFTNSTYRLS